jgi:CDP-diacylglycerol pyrophosphatase
MNAISSRITLEAAGVDRSENMRLFWIVPWLLLSVPCLADPSALWHITNGQCVPNERATGNPKPCIFADLDEGFVILKDRVGKTQYLLMPTARISGIEDPAVLASEARNYWDDAWRARFFTEERAGKALPRDALSLAVNSPSGRSQDQLHIHIDCVRPDVREALLANRDSISSLWARFPVLLAGLPWRAMRVDGINLGSANPFRLLADGDPDAGADMKDHTLAVVGMIWPDGEPGFVVLDGKVGSPPGNRGSAEVLQDHDCKLAAQ